MGTSSSSAASAAAAAASDDVLHGRFYGTQTSGKVIVLTDSTIKTIPINGVSSVNGAMNGDHVDLETAKQHCPVNGKIHRVLKRHCKTVCGKIDCRKGEVVVIPTDRRLPALTLVNCSAADSDDLANRWMIIGVDEWKDGAKFFEGHLVEKLDFVGTMSAELRAISCGLPPAMFSPLIISDMEDVPRELTPQSLKYRRDLRSLPICSIDPPGCTDIDDVVYVILLPNGNYELGVCIADVSAYVRPESEVDTEAARRGTSVYLADRTVNMLPAVLSEDLCSLHAGQSRPAFTASSEITCTGDVVATEFFKSLIKSKASFSYRQAQDILNNEVKMEDDEMRAVAMSLKLLRDVTRQLRQKRIENGALFLQSTEIEFTFDNKSHPTTMAVKPTFEVNDMIEEAMVVTNHSAAKLLLQKYRSSALLKIHPAPSSADAFQSAADLSSSAGIQLDLSSKRTISEGLVALTNQPMLKAEISSEIGRSLAPAFYGCSGYRTTEDLGHFGLGISSYATFTSPIRRYADVVVHRMLSVAIGVETYGPSLFDKKLIESLCLNLNELERDAKNAERYSKMLYTQVFVKTHRVRDEGIIVSVDAQSLAVRTKQFELQGKIHLTERQQKFQDGRPTAAKFVFDNKESTVSAAGVTLRMWQSVVIDVEPEKLNPRNKLLKFLLVEPRISGFNDLKRTHTDDDNVLPAATANFGLQRLETYTHR